jgi:hypothetical protein
MRLTPRCFAIFLLFVQAGTPADKPVGIPDRIYSKILLFECPAAPLGTTNCAMGLAVGNSDKLLLVFTAGHVIGLPGTTIAARLVKDKQSMECLAIRSIQTQSDSPTSSAGGPIDDIGIAVCKRNSTEKLSGYDILAEKGEARVGRQVVSFIPPPKAGPADIDIVVAPSRGAIVRNSGTAIEILDTFGFDPRGISGGPLLTESGAALAIQSTVEGLRGAHLFDAYSDALEKVSNDTSLKARIADWAGEGTIMPEFRARLVSASIPAIRPSETEIAVSFTAVQFSNGVTAMSPEFRFSRRLPDVQELMFNFGFQFAQSTPASAAVLSHDSVAMPYIGVQYELGGAFSAVRHFRWLAGPYVGGGVGWAWLNSGAYQSDTESTRSWTGYLEVGTRWRIPGRSFGLQGGYRKVYLLGAQQPDVPSGILVTEPRVSRFSSLSIGAFWALR